MECIYKNAKENFCVYADGSFTENFYDGGRYVHKNNFIVFSCGVGFDYFIPGCLYGFYHDFSEDVEIKWTYEGKYIFIKIHNKVATRFDALTGKIINTVDADSVIINHDVSEIFCVDTSPLDVTFNLSNSFIEQHYYIWLCVSQHRMVDLENIRIVTGESFIYGHGSSSSKIYYSKVEKEIFEGLFITVNDKIKVNEGCNLWKLPHFIEFFVTLIASAAMYEFKFSFLMPAEIFKKTITRSPEKAAYFHKIYQPDIFKQINDDERLKIPFIYHGVAYDNFLTFMSSYLFTETDLTKKISDAFYDIGAIDLFSFHGPKHDVTVIDKMIVDDCYKELMENIITGFNKEQKNVFIKNVFGHVSQNNFEIIIAENSHGVNFQTCTGTVTINKELLSMDGDILKNLLCSENNTYID